MTQPKDSHFERRGDMDSREWNEGMCWESWYDERSERERCGDNRRVAELEQALVDYHTADTEIEE